MVLTTTKAALLSKDIIKKLDLNLVAEKICPRGFRLNSIQTRPTQLWVLIFWMMPAQISCILSAKQTCTFARIHAV